MRLAILPGVKQAREWIAKCRGCEVLSLDPMPGGAGARRYWRAQLADGSKAVLMYALPENPEILPPALRTPSDEIPFVSVSRLLSRHGLPVPELYAVEPEARWILLEDLGTSHLCDLSPAERSQRLHEAIGILARAHAIPAEDSFTFQRSFDTEWIRFEWEHFLEHAVCSKLHTEVAEVTGELAQRIASLPRVLCLRDFQSRNLMIDPAGRLRILDYQDALLAPPELDLAALLYDSYIEIDDALRETLWAAYQEDSGRKLDQARFALLVVQRKAKDFARFRYLVRVKGDVRYAPYQLAARAAVLACLPRLAPPLRKLAEPIGTALREASE